MHLPRPQHRGARPLGCTPLYGGCRPLAEHRAAAMLRQFANIRTRLMRWDACHANAAGGSDSDDFSSSSDLSAEEARLYDSRDPAQIGAEYGQV